LAFGLFGFADTQATEIIDIATARKQTRWHLEHGERVPRALCAGCRRPFAPSDEGLDLADGNRVHLGRGASSDPLLLRDQPQEDGPPVYSCLIAWGERWRRQAREALAAAVGSARAGFDDIPPPEQQETSR
jgi:hypothetical protein